MWILTNFGAFMPALRPRKSIPKGDIRELQIRARRKEDLDRLRDRYLPQLGETIHWRHTDYQFRAYCTHDQWAAALASMAYDIDYVSFKDTAEDEELHDLLYDVWQTIHRAWGGWGSWGRRFLPKPKGKGATGTQTPLWSSTSKTPVKATPAPAKSLPASLPEPDDDDGLAEWESLVAQGWRTRQDAVSSPPKPITPAAATPAKVEPAKVEPAKSTAPVTAVPAQTTWVAQPSLTDDEWKLFYHELAKMKQRRQEFDLNADLSDLDDIEVEIGAYLETIADGPTLGTAPEPDPEPEVEFIVAGNGTVEEREPTAEDLAEIAAEELRFLADQERASEAYDPETVDPNLPEDEWYASFNGRSDGSQRRGKRRRGRRH